MRLFWWIAGVGAVVVVGLLVSVPVQDPVSQAQVDSAELPNSLANDPKSRSRTTTSRGISYDVAAGESGRTGPGELVKFSVEVEQGIPMKPKEFARAVEETLFDHRSWGNMENRALQRVETGADFAVSLTKSSSVDRMCAPGDTFGFVSCFNGERAIINLQRWRKGAPDFPTLAQYRVYLINHEVGHGLLKQHWFCPGPGPGKLMMQQTYMTDDPCDPERFPRPAARRYKTECQLGARCDSDTVHIRGQVSPTAQSVKVRLRTRPETGPRTIGKVKSDTYGKFRVRIPSADFSSQDGHVTMVFDETRTHRGCTAIASVFSSQ